MITNYITFYKDNLQSKEHDKTYSQIIDGFIKTDLFESFKNGWPFQRAILVFMGFTYGTFDSLTDEQQEELWQEMKSRNLTG